MSPYIRYGLLAGSLALAACQPAADDTQFVLVEGRGQTEAEPDAFRLSLFVEANGPDREAALREASEISDRIADILPRMEGLDWIEVNRNDANIRTAYEQSDCRRSYNRPANCVPVGHGVEISISVEAGPVSEAGNLASLASELGARGSELSGFYRRDEGHQTQQARQAAYQDARSQALLLADAAGLELGRVIQIQTVEDFYNGGAMPRSRIAFAEPMLAAEEPAIASIPLQLDPEVRRYEERITVRFELVEPSTSD
ncbi:SIMPL domain-containing protein [Maricaulis parjimensis]|uniref:SIMPL domain-containing protein n=1 Tax=Maricaulis parjimensis TaxID=144023 RepID=UPI00193A3F84|nr:SIMPL domain-containing protein [Maricaulis parjimensis]